MSITLEKTIISSFFSQLEYTNKVLNFIKPEYFTNEQYKFIFDKTKQYTIDYGELPTFEFLFTEIEESKISAEVYNKTKSCVYELKDHKLQNIDWLLETTEKWAKQRALINSISESITLINNPDSNLDGLPEMMKKALSVTLNTDVGHDYNSDYKQRIENYQKVEALLPFTLKKLNDVTAGGIPRKTLNLVVSPTNAGKSMFLCFLAKAYLTLGYNVFYGSFEMSIEEVSKRIDASFLERDINTLKNFDVVQLEKELESKFQKTTGRLFIQEYPMCFSSIRTVEATMDELKIKKDFVPDIIILDYLGIMSSVRSSSDSSSNSYSYLKSVTEELKSFAQSTKTVLWSAHQINRSGFDTTNISMKNIADSMGIVMTADLTFALIRTEEFDAENKVMMKQLKSRYNDAAGQRDFFLKVDRPKMNFTDIEETKDTAHLMNLLDNF